MFTIVTYSLVANPNNLVAESVIETLSSTLTFDLTDYMRDIYAYNQTYGNLFTISMTNSDDTQFCYPFHTSEATDATLRPCLKVTYGYTIPNKFKNDCIVTIENRGSTGVLYPHSALLGDHNNILHNKTTTDSPVFQYILSKNPATGGYTLTNALAPSMEAKVTADTNTKRVYLHSENDPSKQEWLIVPHMNGYRIVLRSDMQYALTAVGSPSGYNDDQTITTDGHVILKKFTGTLSYDMMWHIHKKSDYWNDIYSRGLHVVSATAYEIAFTVKQTRNYNFQTFSTHYTGNHGTKLHLYNNNGTLLSATTNYYEIDPVAELSDRVKRATIEKYPLIAGVVYKLRITPYYENTSLDCYLAINVDIDPNEPYNSSVIERSSLYTQWADYNVIDFDHDMVKDPQQNGMPIEANFNCLGYAKIEYENHIYNQNKKYTHNDAATIGDLDSVNRYFEAEGYVQQQYYSPTCIILYYSENEITGLHYAVSINGIITSKEGTSHLLEHYTYLYHAYDSIAFFVLER